MRRDWKDRAQGYETPSERFCRHNGIPYRGGCGDLAGTEPASRAGKRAWGTALMRLAQVAKKEDQPDG